MAILQAGPVWYKTRTHPFTAGSNIPSLQFPGKKERFSNLFYMMAVSRAKRIILNNRLENVIQQPRTTTLIRLKYRLKY